MTNWPFELPPPNATARRALIDDECNHRGHEEVPAYTQEQVNACITAALRWAAEQCREEIPLFAPYEEGVKITKAVLGCRERILEALPKDEANAA